MTGSADNPPRWLSLDEKNSMQYGPKHGTFPTIVAGPWESLKSEGGTVCSNGFYADI